VKTYKTILTDSILAAAAVVAKRFIGVDGNYCGANAAAWGVSELATAIGEQIPVITHGIALVESGGIIAAGNKVISDSTGRAVAAAALAAAAPAITYDKTKLTIDSGGTAVTSSAANGAVLTIASGMVALAAPVLSGSYLPVAVNGMALDAASGAGEFIRVRVPA
jgi:hypothetical protein